MQQGFSLRSRKEGLVRPRTSYSERVLDSLNLSPPLLSQGGDGGFLAYSNVLPPRTGNSSRPLTESGLPPSMLHPVRGPVRMDLSQINPDMLPVLEAPASNGPPSQALPGSAPADILMIPEEEMEAPAIIYEDHFAEDAKEGDPEPEPELPDLRTQQASEFSNVSYPLEPSGGISVTSSQAMADRQSRLSKMANFNLHEGKKMVYGEFERACFMFGKRLYPNQMRCLFNKLDVNREGLVTVKDFLTSPLMNWQKRLYKPPIGPVWEKPGVYGGGRAFKNALNTGNKSNLTRRVSEMHRRNEACAAVNLMVAKAKLGGQAKHVTAEQLNNAFCFFDVDRTGKISQDEFKAAFDYLEVGGNRQEITDLIRTFDPKSTGLVDYTEFVVTYDHGFHKNVYKPFRATRENPRKEHYHGSFRLGCMGTIKGRDLPWSYSGLVK